MTLITDHERANMERAIARLADAEPVKVATLVSITGLDPTTTRLGFATAEQVAFDEMLRGTTYVILPCPIRVRDAGGADHGPVEAWKAAIREWLEPLGYMCLERPTRRPPADRLRAVRVRGEA